MEGNKRINNNYIFENININSNFTLSIPCRGYFDSALAIKSYLKLLKYIEENNCSYLLSDDSFWEIKLSNEFNLSDTYIKKFKGEKLHAKYKSEVVGDLDFIFENLPKYNTLSTSMKKLLDKLLDTYRGDFKDYSDLQYISNKLRKEANVFFPIVYERKVYSFICNDNEELNSGLAETLIEEFKPGQFIILSNKTKSIIVYAYQNGDYVLTEEISYSFIPNKLLYDSSEEEIRFIYGIDI